MYRKTEWKVRKYKSTKGGKYDDDVLPTLPFFPILSKRFGIKKKPHAGEEGACMTLPAG